MYLHTFSKVNVALALVLPQKCLNKLTKYVVSLLVKFASQPTIQDGFKVEKTAGKTTVNACQTEVYTIKAVVQY